MKISHKMIQEDVQQITSSLKKEDAQIPSLWDSLKAGLLLMILIVSWQSFVAFLNVSRGHASLLNPAYLSVVMSFIVSFFAFLASSSFFAKYLSLPKEVIKNSIIIKVIRKKLRAYLIAWVFVVLFAGGACVVFPSISAIFSSVTQFLSLVILYFIFTIDISRYDLSMLSSLISSWRNGDI